MSELLRSAAIRRIESAAMASLPAGTLMSRAADAVVDATASLARSLEPRRPIVAWVGPGNNGGDALLAALRLREHGFATRAIALDARRTPGGDAGQVWRLAHERGFPIEGADAWEELLSPASDRPGARLAPILIDGVFGIGLQRPLASEVAALCERIAQRRWPVVAVDVPSGIDADTGARLGAHALRASVTVTMIADKPGLHTGAALDHAGVVHVAKLGIDAAQRRAALDGTALAEHGRIADRGRLFDRERAIAAALPRRANDTSKGSFGSVLCYGGAPGLRGAVLLAARGAQAIGCKWPCPIFSPTASARPARSPRSCAASRCSRERAASSRRPRAAGRSSTPARRRWPVPAPATSSRAPVRRCWLAVSTPCVPPASARGCMAPRARHGRASTVPRTD